MNRHPSHSSAAFTLVELLVVVGIIAVLAAIAVPNYLSAQIRSKVSRVKADQRTLATALDVYATDNGAFPLCNAYGVAGARPSKPGDLPVLERLSTPVAYITSAFPNCPFEPRRFSGPFVTGLDSVPTNTSEWPQAGRHGPDGRLYRTYLYTSTRLQDDTLTGLDRATVEALPAQTASATGYILQAPGPDLCYISMGGVVTNASKAYATDLLYDPTNGTASFGVLLRTGGQTPAEDNIYSATRSAGQ